MKLAINWKKHLRGFAGLAVSLGALFAVVGQGEVAAATTLVRTNGNCLNIRTGPSSAYPSVACAPNGSTLQSVVRYKNGFAQLSGGNWVAANYIRSTQTVRPSGSNSLGVGGTYYLRRGSSGAAVRAVQDALDIRRDGIYGAQTESAVRRFQSRNGLMVDGIVGSQTIRAIQRMAGDV